MEIQDALKRIEWGYGGVEEAAALREALEEIPLLSRAGIMALLDHDLPRVSLQLKRIERSSTLDEESDDD